MKLVHFLTVLCFFAVKCGSMSQSEIDDFANFLQETSRLDQNLKSKDPEADFDEDDAIENAWEESGKFEGDLVLNDRQRRMIMTNVVEGLARNGLTDSTKRWPNNEVIYFIQREHFNLGQVQAIQDGLDDLARVSCVKFTPYKKGDRDAVVIQGSRRGCFSQVGYQGGYQVLNLSGRHPVGRGCFRHGTVVHELLHTLGFYHMQSSPDRDDYIDVLWENIIQATRHNFRKYNSFAVSDFGIGYDYDSVLHYSRKAFSANGKDTLVPKKLGASIGQRTGLSQKDIQKLNKMYCDAESDLFLDDSSKSPVIKKKTSKNKPFQGHGIGYHQGKTVVINLPDAQTYTLHDLNIDKLNDFSRAKETSMPSMPVQGFRVTQEINAYSMPESMFNNVNDKNEELQGLLNRFSNVVNSEMNPTDARKFDYEQMNSNYYNNNMNNPVQVKSYINKASNNERPKLPIYQFESEDILAIKNKENRHEDNRSESKYPYSYKEGHTINRYNNNIAHYSDDDQYTPMYNTDVPYRSESFLNGQRSLHTPKYERQGQVHQQFKQFYLHDR